MTNAEPIPDSAACKHCRVGLKWATPVDGTEAVWVHVDTEEAACGGGDAERAVVLLQGVQTHRLRRAAWEQERAADNPPLLMPQILTRAPSKWLAIDLEDGSVWEFVLSEEDETFHWRPVSDD